MTRLELNLKLSNLLSLSLINIIGEMLSILLSSMSLSAKDVCRFVAGRYPGLVKVAHSSKMNDLPVEILDHIMGYLLPTSKEQE